jgi:large subunit ribosomal protein L24
MSRWIRKGDKVVVIAGNEKGKTGEVIVRKEDRVIIQGINIRKKHVKRQQKAAGAGIIEIEVPLHVSNVALCNGDGKPVKPRVRHGADGEKELFYLEGDREVALRKVKKHS